MNADTRRAQRHGLKLKMRALARIRTCPACHRRYALKRYPGVVVCRYCGYERAPSGEPREERDG